MTRSPKLVLGASGYLGSNVVRRLVERGEQVRVLLRPTSSTRGIEDLDVEPFYGGLWDTDTLRAAMTGVDDVFYCVVDARPWARDPSELFRTNVEGLRSVLDVAVRAELHRFVFTSTVATLARKDEGLVEESEPHNWWDRAGPYTRSRVEAEQLLLSYVRDRGLPGVAMCVANTYGPGAQQAPHSEALGRAATGRDRTYLKGYWAEVVDVRDAAEALVLAAERGKPGERYAVAAGWWEQRELHRIAADATGAPTPNRGIPFGVLRVLAAGGEMLHRLGRDCPLNRETVDLMRVMTPLSHAKTERELGWQPRPVEQTVRDAALYFAAEQRTPTSQTGEQTT